MEFKDYYKVLGVEPTASGDEIERSGVRATPAVMIDG